MYTKILSADELYKVIDVLFDGSISISQNIVTIQSSPPFDYSFSIICLSNESHISYEEYPVIYEIQETDMLIFLLFNFDKFNFINHNANKITKWDSDLAELSNYLSATIYSYKSTVSGDRILIDRNTSGIPASFRGGFELGNLVI